MTTYEFHIIHHKIEIIICNKIAKMTPAVPPAYNTKVAKKITGTIIR
jgi:hypothetical protein